MIWRLHFTTHTLS